MTTEQDQEPTRQLIIPSGFGSSERQTERIAQLESIRSPSSSRKDISEEFETEKESTPRFKEFQGSQRAVILDDKLSATEVELPITETADDSPIEIEDEPVIIENDPQPSRVTSRKLSFLENFNAARRGVKAGLTSDQAKRIARSSKTAAARTARTSANVGAKTRGVVLVAGKRIEERTLDRPRNQKAFFRPLESSERRRLGLPTNEPISREDLRLIALGVTPPSVIRARIAQTKQIDVILDEYREKLEELPVEANKPNIMSELDQELFQLRKANADPDLIARKEAHYRALREPARKALEYNQIIDGLEARKIEVLASAKNEIDPRIRNRAFSQALKLSSSLTPVGSLSSTSKPKSTRGPGRPPTKKKPELKVRV